jgi:hypothetical protein
MWQALLTGIVHGMSTPVTTSLPLPGTGSHVVAAPAPGPGPQNWAGAPSAALDEDGSIIVGYRVRHAGELRDEVVIARSEDGERLETVTVLTRDQFGAEMLERPALARTETGTWRAWVGVATPGTKHWRIEMLEAPTPEDLVDAHPTIAFAGDPLTIGVKDPVVRRTASGWHAWLCGHHLEVPGQEDRMCTIYATSRDGLRWSHHGIVLRGRSGAWDARGGRVTSVLPGGWFAYDARATAEENWWERTGLARVGDGRRLDPVDGDPVAAVRYLDVLALPGGGHRLFYEAPNADESHELRTELLT